MVVFIKDKLHQIAGVTGPGESLHTTREYDLEPCNREHGHCACRDISFETLRLPFTMILHFTCTYFDG